MSDVKYWQAVKLKFCLCVLHYVVYHSQANPRCIISEVRMVLYPVEFREIHQVKYKIKHTIPLNKNYMRHNRKPR